MKPILLFALLTLSLTAVAQKVTPMLNLTAGNTYSLSITTKTTVLQNIRGREVKVITTAGSRVAITIKNLTDTVYTADASYPSLQLTIKTADTTLNFRSDKKGGKPDTASAILAAIAGKTFTIKFSRRGNLIMLDNPDKLINDAVMLFRGLDPVKKQKISSQLINAFGEGSLKAVFGLGMASFPGRPLQKNDTWEKNIAISYPAPAQEHLSYKLTTVPPTDYMLHASATITADKGSGPINISGFAATYQIDGTMFYELSLDPKTGWIKNVKVVGTVQENVVIKDSEKTPGGLTIPMMFVTEMIVQGF